MKNSNIRTVHRSTYGRAFYGWKYFYMSVYCSDVAELKIGAIGFEY